MPRTIDNALDGRVKGVPWSAHGIPLSAIGEQRWNVLAQDLPLPVAVIRASALRGNLRWMREFAEASGVLLAPHGKTTMSPELFAMQLAENAWGLTLATMQQVRVAREARIQRILFANQLVAPQDLSYVVRELVADQDFEFYALVDSEAGVARIADAVRANGSSRPVSVLIELGYPGGRAGCRDLACALNVARAVRRASPHVALHGVECYEGLHGSGDPALNGVRALLDFAVDAARAIDADGLFDGETVLLSAGGSAYFDVVTDAFQSVRLTRKTAVVVRSGCYLLHDAGNYASHFDRVRQRSLVASRTAGSLENALEVWTYVSSVPEAKRAILGAGRRDLGYDAGMPVPLRHFRPGRDESPRVVHDDWEIVALNDQHAHLRIGATDDLAVGDMIALGVSHPCTTLDKWQLLYLVDDAYTVQSALQTFF